MKEIKNLEVELCEEIEKISQNIHQWGNKSITHLKIGKANIIKYDDCSYTIFYLLGKDEEVDLEDFASDCANEADFPNLELIAWGLMDPEDIEIDEEYEGECRVLIKECYAGYSPLKKTGIFPDFHSAQVWVENQDNDNKVYYCRHGEMGRPSHTIIPA